MEEFNELQNLWKKNKTSAAKPVAITSEIKSNRMKLRKTQIREAATLIFSGLLVIGLMATFNAKLQTVPIMSAMILISTVCFLQAALMLYTAKKIDGIDEAQPPAIHLQQWLDFREFQKKQRHWNLPVYYVLLGSALAVYLYELLKTKDLWILLLAFGLTYGWLLFAYFYLGKREMKKQDAKTDGIISELKNLENQFH